MSNPSTAESPSRAAWRNHPNGVAPVVLILGGFLMSPPLYRPFRDRLLRRGAAGVVVAGVWTPDWLLAGVRGLGPIVDRGARGLRTAVALSRATPASGGAAVLVVGHSAGGLIARLLTAEQPFEGRRYAAAPSIGAIVTLGTPHVAAGDTEFGRRPGGSAIRFAERVVPGTFHAPRVGYLSVAARGIAGRPDGTGRERTAARLYRGILPGADGEIVEGDGLVPVRAAILAGSRHLVLDDVDHGPGSGRPWYGADRGLDGWWDEAVTTWRAALVARIDARPSATGRERS